MCMCVEKKEAIRALGLGLGGYDLGEKNYTVKNVFYSNLRCNLIIYMNFIT